MPVVMSRGLCQFGFLLLLLTLAGCGGEPATQVTVPAPADEFKSISDAKKAQLSQFLQTKQSSLAVNYNATVKEESNVEARVDHTHVGEIKFSYATTPPLGESLMQHLYTAVATYHFSAKSKKWVYLGCFPEDRQAPERVDALVKFSEVKAAFER
ncbi:MAG: hypothetical protein K2R98_23070 [Gemmataceae bacterium]|nr:hypothetical protein [Gemmataceae bacterium]